MMAGTGKPSDPHPRKENFRHEFTCENTRASSKGNEPFLIDNLLCALVGKLIFPLSIHC